jgi:hypothetical protein
LKILSINKKTQEIYNVKIVIISLKRRTENAAYNAFNDRAQRN